jgi:branched-subunit amino acid ABC-type transport system permease component
MEMIAKLASAVVIVLIGAIWFHLATDRIGLAIRSGGPDLVDLARLFGIFVSAVGLWSWWKQMRR